jgi:hypothetical protein
VDVTYNHTFGYRDSRHGFAPILLVTLALPALPDLGIDVEAYLDSGATHSLFDGELAVALGLGLVSGPPRHYYATTGDGVQAHRHSILLRHAPIPPFTLEIGFSTSPIARNLLGRDLFNLLQVGFRERRSEFYIEPLPRSTRSGVKRGRLRALRGAFDVVEIDSRQTRHVGFTPPYCHCARRMEDGADDAPLLGSDEPGLEDRGRGGERDGDDVAGHRGGYSSPNGTA